MTASKKSSRSGEREEPTQQLSTSLGLGWQVEVTPGPRQATVTVRHPSGRSEIEVEIVLGADGPRVRTRAATVDVETTGDIAAKCASFRVDARETIELVAGNSARIEGREVDVASRAGDVRIHANDDVKLTGELVLLNCDRAEPEPTWTGSMTAPVPSIPVESMSGSIELARIFEKQK